MSGTGVIWSPSGSGNFGGGNPSDSNKQIAEVFSKSYGYDYYVQQLSNEAKAVNSPTIGAVTDLDPSTVVYSYSGYSYYSLSSSFVPASPATIFLINGSLDIPSDFTIPADSAVAFIVKGNVSVASNVNRIPGLYIIDETFAVSTGANRLIIDGMVHARSLSLNRTYAQYSESTYQFIYQPTYAVTLMPYLGRQSILWQEKR